MAASMGPISKEETEKPVLESLNLFYAELEETTKPHDELLERVICPCVLCEEKFNISEDRDELLRHMVTEHKFVIADVNLISDLKKYFLYWKQRMKEESIDSFCTMIFTNTDPKDIGPKEQYYLLCDVLEEDKKLREFLQKRKLEKVLSLQQSEREDISFSRTCLFCREHFTGQRGDLFDHMAHDHGFNVGLPDNLVYTNEFLEKLQEKLDNLQCLYCEKTFRDRTVLKEHMRKKQHKRINPKNKTYDKYYIINYLEMGKTWESIQSEPELADDTDNLTESEEEWDDWDETGSQAVCLFCEFSSSNAEKLKSHMQELHDLDLQEIKLRLNLNFYQQVKLVNFIRRQVHLGVCIGCEESFDSKQSVLDHMHEKSHTSCLPDKSVWDQPQYYFPTYENDNLLCQLDDNGEDDDDDSGQNASCFHSNVTVIAEDNPVKETILMEESVRNDILYS